MNIRKNEHLKYLISNNFNRSWGLYATTIGFQNISPKTSYPPQGHPSEYIFKTSVGRILQEYQLIYIVEGKGSFQSTSCSTMEVNAGSVILLFPGEWHTFSPSETTGWQVYWLGFDGKHAHSLFTDIFSNKENAVFDIGFNEFAVFLLEKAIEVANSQRHSYQEMMAGIIHHLVSFLFYTHQNKTLVDQDVLSIIDKARMIMTANAYNKKSPEEIAEELNLSYSWFRKLFKQYTGFSPLQYQMEIKLEKAKELLSNTSKPIKTIAYELNFESISYFVTFFKSKTGMSPKIYRLSLVKC
ncbi:AraC family transcriptional regulator [Sphingobacterium corticis]|uniref:AraC family transcriptional regulator n=1 Tax=Sphingobacterium corticis TaxID=1812823 RepID=A0ABW5NIR7_9SPHI